MAWSPTVCGTQYVVVVALVDIEVEKDLVQKLFLNQILAMEIIQLMTIFDMKFKNKYHICR